MKPLLPQKHKQSLGAFGERLASIHLEKNGYSIVETNYKARYGEIDIIAGKDHALIFVEVKTRIGTRYGTPEEAVTPKKIRELVKTAQYYVLTHNKQDMRLQIDVIAIQLSPEGKVQTLTHHENITA